MSLPDVLANPAIQQMAQKRAELEAQYEQDLQHRMPDHPVVKQELAAIQSLDRQTSALATGIRNSIQNQYKTSVAQEAELAGAVNQLKGATLAEQSLGIRYNILKREVDTNRELYNALLQRYKEVSAEAGVTSNNISVIDRADPPLLPVSPNPKINIALSLLAGLVLAMAAVAALETFRDGVRAPDEVEQRFGVPLLGVIPRLKGPAAAQLVDRSSEISEAYQTVRASVELVIGQGHSSNPGRYQQPRRRGQVDYGFGDGSRRGNGRSQGAPDRRRHAPSFGPPAARDPEDSRAQQHADPAASRERCHSQDGH